MNEAIQITLQRAIATFGEQHQIDKAIEEMGELTTSLIQYRDGRVKASDVHTEIADVRIMMEQLTEIFGETNVLREYDRKIWRLDDTIREKHAADRANDEDLLRHAESKENISLDERERMLSQCRWPITRKKLMQIFSRIRKEETCE